ncbi:MAG TPA: histidine kinase dimerization/phospho-acceptor domain-containing protein [Pseudolabrys sp.]|nr:histidine kinase dimerization/phospho-acceptor domain-containing protein [Pseudolabrys sp.]
MTAPEFRLAFLSDPRLAAHALSPVPTWLWRIDAAQILWANPTGAAIFNARSPAALRDVSFDAKHPAAAQIARLAGTLPQGGGHRLERLRGFGAGVGAALMCVCSRITLADNSAAVLVVSTERAGPDLPLPERVRRLLADSRIAAAFSADGELIEATPAAAERFGAARDLIALGAQQLAQEATHNGHAEGEIAGMPAALDRLGAGAAIVLLATLGPAHAEPAPMAAAPPIAPSAPAEAPPAPAAIAEAPAAEIPAASPAPPQMPATGKRRLPLRFVWQIDSDDRFTITSDEFAAIAGRRTADAIGQPWADIADALGIDPDRTIARALASHETWSGIIVQWPINGHDERLPVELSGLPVFDHDRNFIGYRGFGVCRDLARLDAIEKAHAEAEALAKAKAAEAPPAPQPEPIAEPAPEQPGNVLQFPPPVLTPREHSAFDQIGRELGDRLKSADSRPSKDDFAPAAEEPPPPPPKPRTDAGRNAQEGRPILDRLPIGILVYRLNDLIYANRAFLDWTGYPTLEALAEAGGLDSLFIENTGSDAGKNSGNGKTLTISTQAGEQMPVEGRLFSVTWNGESALVLMLSTATAPASTERQKGAELALRQAQTELRELHAILDTATDGVLIIDRSGRVLSANRSAEALFGYDAAEFGALTFGDLFAVESRRPVLDYLDELARDSAASLLGMGREVFGRVRQGGLIPLFMTMGRVGDDGEKFCAVLRDITAWKKTEDELVSARQQAEKASFAKSEFLAKMSHEIRTPLNAIIGFSEVMMEERFGPVGNERYRQYLRDIHSSGGHLISLLNDLLDLSKIEAGKLDLTFVSVNLNDAIQQCVAIMQQQANRERVIIRVSLAAALPQVVADLRSVRQILLNLLSNSIKFTGAGGQVIISTALTDAHEVVVRVRDTGAGMSEKELQTALEPFRQLATSVRWGSSGTGLGLPITKALTEANHARFTITSVVSDGTLVEVAFPANRLLAQ